MSTKVKLVPPGYFACRTIINVLKGFRNLVLYYIPYAGYDERASATLEELLSENIQETSRGNAVLKENIDKLIPTVKINGPRLIDGKYLLERCLKRTLFTDNRLMIIDEKEGQKYHVNVSKRDKTQHFAQSC